jgi:hypothetical protein
MRDTERENDSEVVFASNCSTRSEWNDGGGKAFAPSAKVNDSLNDTTFVAFTTSV